MGKGVSPLLGFNTNVRHKGKVFHIQTEDSGVQHPHIITHLFADGGRIIKSVKTPYGEQLALPDWETPVKKLMQEQHKAMFEGLRNGQFDALIDPRLASVVMGAVKPPVAGAGGAAPIAPTAPGPAAPPVNPSVIAIPAAGGAAKAPVLPTVGVPSRAATGPNVPSASSQVGTTSQQVPGPPSSPGKVGRYASIRSPETASAFAAPKQESGNIFGESLMSEKSLDEVILAFLAEEDEGGKR